MDTRRTIERKVPRIDEQVAADAFWGAFTPRLAWGFAAVLNRIPSPFPVYSKSRVADFSKHTGQRAYSVTCSNGLLHPESIRSYPSLEQSLPMFTTGYLNRSLDV